MKNMVATTYPFFIEAAETALGVGDSPLEPRPMSIAEQIAARISLMLENGELKPGDRILEVELAEQFRVSRGPVREALHLLHKDGVIEILPRRGAHVFQPTPQELRNLYDIRATLIGMAAGKAALAPDKSLLELAKQGAAIMAEVALESGSSIDAFLKIRGLTGLLMLRMSGNMALEVMVRRMSLQTALHSLGFETVERRMEASQIWLAIFDAIEKSDAAAAEQAGKRLVMATSDAIVKKLEAVTLVKVGKRVQRKNKGDIN
jgi:DNA-binding GntR family transcriptional regulator